MNELIIINYFYQFIPENFIRLSYFTYLILAKRQKSDELNNPVESLYEVMLYVLESKQNQMAVYSQFAYRIYMAQRTTELVDRRAYCLDQNPCSEIYPAVWYEAISLTWLNFLICTYILGRREVWLILSLVKS